MQLFLLCSDGFKRQLYTIQQHQFPPAKEVSKLWTYFVQISTICLTLRMVNNMDIKIRTDFIDKWTKYFPGSELPIACYYADELNGAEFPDAPKPKKQGLTCIFSQLAPVRGGKARAFNQDNLGCWGAKGTFGFIPSGADEQTVDFLVNVERYKKSAEHVESMFKPNPPIKAKGKYLIFKRWDLLTEKDEPQVVFFFCQPDVFSGLHGLANFDTMDPHGVITPDWSGCDMLAHSADEKRRAADQPGQDHGTEHK